MFKVASFQNHVIMVFAVIEMVPKKLRVGILISINFKGDVWF